MDSALSDGEHLTDAASITLTAADLAAIDGLRRMHSQRIAIPAETTPAPTPDTDVAETSETVDDAVCPVPGFLRGKATTCPVLPDADPNAAPVHRSKADLFVRRLLRIRDTKNLSDRGTYRIFQRSMLISAIRCTLTYVIFPIVLPGIGFLRGVGPVVGIFIGTFALICDTLTIRRFFVVDHKYRWYFSAIAFAVMILLTILLVQDVSHVVSRLVS